MVSQTNLALIYNSLKSPDQGLPEANMAIVARLIGMKGSEIEFVGRDNCKEAELDGAKAVLIDETKTHNIMLALKRTNFKGGGAHLHFFLLEVKKAA